MSTCLPTDRSLSGAGGAPGDVSDGATMAITGFEAHGRTALIRLGSRLTLVYLAAAGFGVTAGLGRQGGARGPWTGLQMAGLGFLAAIAIGWIRDRKSVV